jgi:DNA modification methylase
MSHHITNHLIIQGDCIDGMKTVPSESVHCVVTSPPYYGLRDYGTATWEGGDPLCNHTISMDTKWNDPKRGTDVLRPEVAHRGGSSSNCHLCGATRIDQQIGLEESPDEYVARLVEVFREVRRILRHDGTVWLNLGDSYAGNNSQASNNGRAGYGNPRERVVNRISEGLKPKDLIGIPWRVAFALQADGWYLRQDIIWHKPNPMPESVSDRCTKSHEYIFLLTKSERYYYDKDAIMEVGVMTSQSSAGSNQRDTSITHGIGGGNSGINEAKKKLAQELKLLGHSTRNKRSVWTVATQPYPEAHFATFPTKLIEPCILAGTSEKGCCSTCGAPWKRVTEKTGEFQRRWSTNNAEGSPYESQGSMQNTYETTGWQPTCKCEINDPVPCTVFDPFTGSGTTGLVALTNNRMFVGTELNPEYVKIAEKRLSIVQPKLI